MPERTLFALLLLVLAPSGAAQEWVEEVDRLTAAGELDRAVFVLEERLKSHPGDAALHRAHARALARLVDQGGATWLAMNDARDAWDRALELEPVALENLRGAVEVRMRLGEYAAAAGLALRALGTATLAEGSVPEDLLVLSLRARIGAFQTAEAELPERLRELEELLRVCVNARRLAPGSAELVRVEAGFLDWLGHPDRAVALLKEALEVHSDRSELHRMLIDIHVRERVEERLRRFYAQLGERATNATLAWYTGYVARLTGDLALRERRHANAFAAYESCRRWMEVARTLEPDFAATAATISHQAAVSTAWCSLDARDEADARQRLFALLEQAPERRNEPDGLGRSVLQAFSALGQRAVGRNDFRTAAEDARAIVAIAPEEGPWWNNLGFLLREYATQVLGGAFPEVAAPEERSLEIFRESWRAYRRAAELAPEDARIVNDAALIQVYHLRDELELAERMFLQSIRIGEAQLEELGPDAEEAERFPIAQAVGDAYQNLGYLYYHVYGEPERSREYWVAAMATDSGDRSNLEAYLTAIDGDGEPVPERDSVSAVQAPLAENPVSIELPWESDLEEARALARMEKRPLLIYNRGEGLGLLVPYYDRWVQTPRFGERTAGAIPLVADALRRTFVDRRRDGRRVVSPVWGGITCGEHIQVREDFDLWYTELFGEEPGESAEGLWVLWPGEEVPVVLSTQEELAQLDGTPLAGPSVPPFEVLEAALSGSSGGDEARELVETRSRHARDRVEQILWDGFRSGPAHGHLVAALAADDHPKSREILAACVRQTANPEVSRLALEVWPEGADLFPVWFAARWGHDAAVREAAWAILTREVPDDLAVSAAELVRQ